MRKPVLHFISILALLALVACESPPAIAPVTPDSVVLAFGDSLTYGTGAAEGGSYPAVLSGMLGVPVINAGVPGEVTARGVVRLPQLLAEHQPDLVILCHGGNDFLRRQNRQQTISNLKRMVEMIQASGADAVLLGVPQFGFVLEPPAFYREIAEFYQVPYEGGIVSDLLSDRGLKSDQIHPNSKGYRLMAEAVYELIRDAEKD